MAALFAAGGLVLARAFPEIAQRRVVLWVLVWASPAAVMNALTGQLGGLWFAALACAAWALRGRRPLVAGMLLGLLWVKPTLALPVALGLLLAGQTSALAGLVLGGGIVLGLSLAADGIGPWLRYLEMMRDTPDLTHRMWLHPERQLTLRTLTALPFRGGDLAAPLGWAGVAAGLALCAWVAPASWRACRQEGTAMFGVAVALSAALLTAPHLFDYDLGMHAMGMLASASLLAAGSARRPRVGWFLWIAVFFAPLAYPAARWLSLSLGTVVLAAWVVWMTLELREISRRSEAGRS